MATQAQAYQSIAAINLWFKLKSGDRLTLTDVPAIIPLRWDYFSQNWNFLLPSLQQKVASYKFSDLFAAQLIDFTNFINIQRHNTSSINPLSDGSVLYRFYTVFDNIQVQSINLTNEESTILTTVTNTVSQYTKNDFLQLRSNIINFRDRQSDIVRLTDATYNATFDRSAVVGQTSAQVQDVEYLQTLQSSIQTIDFILSNLFSVDIAVDPFALARANANNPKVNIGQYSSGQLVRFHYEDDLESLAARYLGDPNKWIDIAIANGLQPPYIDEVGQVITLQANGSGNQINIPATDASGNDNSEKFFVNQTIFLQSNTQLFPDQRTVVNMNVVQATGDIVLTLDGASNLSQYTTAAGAYVRVYAPHTINSGLYILIPSTKPLPNSREETVPWFLAKSAEDEKRMGIDLLLSNSDDLVFTSNDDLSLSFGLQNAVQAMRLKVVTELGELRFHPGFGLVNVLGSKNSNISAVKASIINSLTRGIAQDSRFDRMESLNVAYVAVGAPAFVINLEVRLAGKANQVIPISFNISYT